MLLLKFCYHYGVIFVILTINITTSNKLIVSVHYKTYLSNNIESYFKSSVTNQQNIESTKENYLL